MLKTNSRYKISHALIAGSGGKQTAIIDSDVDCVLFLNDELPRFDAVLDDWENIFIVSEGLGIHQIRTTKFSIQFKSKNFDFDFLPATNFTKGYSGDHVMEMQQKITLEHIQKNPEKYSYLFSSALAQSVVDFIRKQEGFVNEMIRIAKFWYKTLNFSEYISGAKYLIEIITVHAAKMERASGAPTNKMYLRCLGRIMDYIIKFDSLKIIFENEYANGYLKNVAKQMSANPPCVLDPSNPYNNLAKAFSDKPRMKDLLVSYAKETKNRLHQVFGFRLENSFQALEYVFQPQPLVIPDLPTNIRNAKFLVGCDRQVLNYPDRTIRNNRIEKDPSLLRIFDLMEVYFTLVMSIYKSDKGASLNQVQNLLTKTIDQSIHGHEPRLWSSASDLHENYDVTFTLNFGNKGCLKISMKDLYP